MRRNPLIGVCLGIALATASCQDQSTEPTAPAAAPAADLKQATPKLQLNRNKLPAGRLTDQRMADLVRRAIDPDEHVCEDPAPGSVVDWLFGEVDKIDNDVLGDLFFLGADIVPTLDALFFQTETKRETFGYRGEYNRVMEKTEKDVKRFWDIDARRIQLIGMHGTMLLDVNRVAQVFEAFFFDEVDENGNPIPLTPAQARAYAEQTRDAVLADPDLARGNHPLFSFNAFAVQARPTVPGQDRDG